MLQSRSFVFVCNRCLQSEGSEEHHQKKKEQNMGWWQRRNDEKLFPVTLCEEITPSITTFFSLHLADIGPKTCEKLVGVFFLLFLILLLLAFSCSLSLFTPPPHSQGPVSFTRVVRSPIFIRNPFLIPPSASSTFGISRNHSNASRKCRTCVCERQRDAPEGILGL